MRLSSMKSAASMEPNRIQNAQQPDAERPQIIFFGGVVAHLVDLRVDRAVKFNG